MTRSFTDSLASGPHQLINAFVGAWEGTVKTWFEPDKLADTSPIRGTVRAILGGRFVVHEYEGTLGGAPMLGHATLGYDLYRQQFIMAWCNNAHNDAALMHSVGEIAAPTDQFNVLGHYPDGVGGPDWGWRTTIEKPADNKLLIVHDNITPDGQEAKGVEIDYTRL